MTTINSSFFKGNEVPDAYTALVQPHVDSFDYFCGEGMELAVASMEPLEVRPNYPKPQQGLWVTTYSRLFCFV